MTVVVGKPDVHNLRPTCEALVAQSSAETSQDGSALAAMPIPSPNAQGFLDPSPDPYPGTLAELHERFVVQSPAHQDVRARVFRALELHLELLLEVGGPAKVWIDGGFVTYKAAPPKDVDLVYLCRDDKHMGDMLRANGIIELLTLQDVIFAFPFAGAARRVQPVGGLVDAFLATPPDQMFWASWWSKLKGPDGKPVPGTRKGFVEVSL
jgi:hypothetical protein